MSEGPEDACGVASVTSFIQELGHTRLALRTDGEPAIIAFAEAVRNRLSRHGELEHVSLQAAPLHSHQSVGAAEGLSRQLADSCARFSCR